MKGKNTFSQSVTKADLELALKGVVRKDDLKGFATKDDLKKFATKDDLKGFATKDDLKKFATKTELKNTERALRAELLRLEGKIENSDENSKKYRDQILTKLDEVMGELQTMREENTIGVYQTSELKRRVDSHEERLDRLEKPQ